MALNKTTADKCRLAAMHLNDIADDLDRNLPIEVSQPADLYVEYQTIVWELAELTE
jgi:hypothetical protein